MFPAVTLASILLAAALPPGTTLSVDPSASVVRFRVTHPLHTVDGWSKAIEGKAMARSDGTVVAMVRLPLSSFHSGDGNRDAHMLEVLEVEKHPSVVFRGTLKLDDQGTLPAGPVLIAGEVDLHGIRTPISVPVTLESQGDGVWRAKGAFDVSLDAHNVERPALLFVKIADECHIEIDLLMRRSEAK